jgi:hypothetical protein
MGKLNKSQKQFINWLKEEKKKEQREWKAREKEIQNWRNLNPIPQIQEWFSDPQFSDYVHLGHPMQSYIGDLPTLSISILNSSHSMEIEPELMIGLGVGYRVNFKQDSFAILQEQNKKGLKLFLRDWHAGEDLSFNEEKFFTLLQNLIETNS